MLLRLLECAAALVRSALTSQRGVHELAVASPSRKALRPPVVTVGAGLVSVPMSAAAVDFLQEILLGWIGVSPVLDSAPPCDCASCRAYVHSVMHAMIRHSGDCMHSPVVTSIAVAHLVLLLRHEFDAEEAAGEAGALVGAMGSDELRQAWEMFKRRRAQGTAKRSVM